MRVDHLIVLDTETSGFDDPVGVCELGIMELDQTTLDAASTMHSLIDPEVPISFGASGVHHITNDMVGDKPTLDEYFTVVHNRPYEGKSVVMVAHNAAYDYPLVKRHMGDCRPLCTLLLARKLFPEAENHKLATLKYMFGLGAKASNSHSAMNDVVDTADLLRLIVDRTGMSIEELLEFQLQPTKIEVMPFSKYKGQKLGDVPTSFWAWLNKQDGEGVDADLAYSVNQIHPNIRLKEKPRGF